MMGSMSTGPAAWTPRANAFMVQALKAMSDVWPSRCSSASSVVATSATG